MPTEKTLESVREWKLFFEQKGLSNNVIQQYLFYISKLLDNNVPIIFDFNHLTLLLGRQNSYLASVINSPTNHYTSFNLKKRSGGLREITIPFPALLEMQYWIFHNILRNVPVHSSAHGFSHKKSIITNSKIHVDQKQLLKIDLKDFFPSINLSRIIQVFKRLGYPNQISFYLATICSFNGYLPQGAPTSPYLSNIISFVLDKRMIALSKKFDLKYTRYADDITFSGDEIPAKFIKYVTNIVVDRGFKINQEKTRLYKNKSKRIVTGISVIGKEIKLPRTYKRELKQELHYIFKYGYYSYTSKKKIRKYNYIFSVIGKVNFWLSIEPKNEYALIAKVKLAEISNELYLNAKKIDN